MVEQKMDAFVPWISNLVTRPQKKKNCQNYPSFPIEGYYFNILLWFFFVGNALQGFP